LTPILGWAALLRDGNLDPAQRERAPAEIERCARSLARLIDDLLDVSRIVSGKLRLAAQPVEIGPLVDSAVESMRLAAEAKGIRLEVDLGAGGEHVFADPDRLQQVLWNLVSNAIKFTERGGLVQVEVVRTAGQVETRVRDTGRGIEPALLPRVFEAFWQADSTTSRRHTGLGLGLSIVRHLVELHGGTVRAESGGTGQGALFTVSLPATAAQESVLEGHVRRDGIARRLRGARVLVVDDEDGAKEMIRVALELCGVEVRTAGSATQALEVLESWMPNVLVSDIMMAERDGYALIRELRARESTAGGYVPALAFTALARKEDRARAIAAGFDGYVAKPVNPMELITAVAGMADAGQR
jgi:CheY-like chemotaxis protein